MLQGYAVNVLNEFVADTRDTMNNDTLAAIILSSIFVKLFSTCATKTMSLRWGPASSFTQPNAAVSSAANNMHSLEALLDS